MTQINVTREELQDWYDQGVSKGGGRHDHHHGHLLPRT